MHVFVLALLVRAAASSVEKSEWAAFKDKHDKSYAHATEELHRMKVYADNKAYIDGHNMEYAAGKHSFTLGVNQFTDLTVEEWRATDINIVMGSSRRHEIHRVKGEVANGMDWRQYGVVTDVKDQGQCSSSWAFATTGALEGAWALAGNSLTSFSEQQLVDCSRSYGNQGCNGGLMDAAYEYIRDMGIATESSYPYTAHNATCRPFNPVGGLSSFASVSRGSERSLADAVARHGPVAVAIDASHRSFQHYSSGIYNEWMCSSTHLNHGALVVGYEDGYWLVKNSWGTDWGEAGYIRMTKDGGNQCGIATQASYPRV